MVSMRTYPASAYQTLFEENATHLQGGSADRLAALKQVTEQGIPSRRVENWKYTDLRQLAETALPLARPIGDIPDISALALAQVKSHRLVFVNGHFMASVSDDLPDGVRFITLADALGQGAKVLESLDTVETSTPVQLNAAFMQDGAMLEIEAKADITDPIHLVYISTGEPSASYVRNVVRCGAGARVTVLESHLMADECTSNVVTHLDVADNASLTHLKVHQGAVGSIHLGNVSTQMGRDARLNCGLYNFGGGLARTDSRVTLQHPGAEARLTGAYLLDGKAHNDNTIVIDHQAPHCRSYQLFKGALAGTSRGVFQGKVIVAKGAFDTDGQQRCQALLLSERAEQDIKPELEIYNDDVQCAHGATIGQLDEEAVFYLRSRGVPLAEARALLIRAFLAETVDDISHEGVREALQAAISNWLDHQEDQK